MGAAEGLAEWRKCGGDNRRCCVCRDCWGAGGLAASLLSSARSLARRVLGDIVYEDEERLAFSEDSGDSLPGHLMIVGKKHAARLGLTDGFRMVVDEGPEGRQSVCHVRLPILGGCELSCPPG
ncbi:hypothetical protein AV530_013640 [Patagioenas fasciata monilis]|uniref:HINT1 n=1 Tax=Patagioenas fasciata monilis TaxID=372326 RepID=A0A1V4KPZ6_PATFA|nr:hypothetical protein AV530_013640 [Patagioenas fasciata monilis]